MTLPSSFIDPPYRIYIALAQYPVLQDRIRERMREEIFVRGIISVEEFNDQVRAQATESQAREAIAFPIGEEPPDVWLRRKEQVRQYLTDLHFANNLSFELFEEIVHEVLDERGADKEDWLTTWNAELAPIELLLEQALRIERMGPKERKKYEPHLKEIKVVLIRNMISDQLAYIHIARQWLTTEDLLDIRRRKIGRGKIGGKAAGMLLAQRIIMETGDEDVKAHVKIPESYFLAADVLYSFMAHNNLLHWNDQKYKTEEEIRSDYPQLCREYLEGEFPPDIVEELRKILKRTENRPLIVRSSSLLEDSFGTLFAGKYASFFCPNQATPEENLNNLVEAIIKVYASALHANPLLYRRSKGLLDYDERIAVLIQTVQGEQMGDYFLPHAAGVAFSRNLYRWAPEIERDAGFLRLVWGLGTRAVDRVSSDFPRLVALSHPQLHTHSDTSMIHKYSQRKVDLIDLKENEFRTLPVPQALSPDYPIMRYIAQRYQDGYFMSLHSRLLEDRVEDLVITMDELLRRTPLADRMKRILQTLAEYYHSPVDMEFTVQIVGVGTSSPDVVVSILQCRPQSHLQEADVHIPKDVPAEDVVFTTRKIIPHGQVSGIEYVLFVPHEGFFGLPTSIERIELARAVGRLNTSLEGKNFICVGPGRWGSNNPDLGVKVAYSDIYHTRALVEYSGEDVGGAPEPSLGTHFFQDLIEAQIYPLAIYLDDEDMVFNRAFFYDTPNHLSDYLPKDKNFSKALRLIMVKDYRPGRLLDLVMDSNVGQAIAYLVQNHLADKESE
jgi:hypothetical protein